MLPFWHEIYTQYILKYSNRINKITRPLQDKMGVTFFGHHSINLNGCYTVLSNGPAWAEHYIQNKLFENDPFLSLPMAYKSGTGLFCSTPSVGFEQLELTQGIFIVDKTDKEVQFSFFGRENGPPHFTSYLLNQLPLLKTFVHYFKKETDDLFLAQKERQYRLLHATDPLFAISLPMEEKLSFLKQVGEKEAVKKFLSLSEREKECLKAVYHGKTAKETAIDLGLSFRTVETYLVHLANKLGCNSKQEIRKQAEHFSDLCLLE